MKTTRTYTVDSLAIPCWVVAFQTLTGKSRTELEALALKNGWDGKTFGVTVQTLLLMLWDITGKRPSLAASKPLREAGITAKGFNAPHFTGLVIVHGHVMPCIRGRVSNFCGHGDQTVEFIAAL